MIFSLQAVSIKTGERRWFSVGKTPIQVGRSTADDGPDKFAIDFDPSLSREHFAICMDGRRFRISRTRGKNPLYYQGDPLDEFWIEPGEVFTSGQTRFELTLSAAPKENPSGTLTLSRLHQDTAVEQNAYRCLRALLALQPLLANLHEPKAMFNRTLPVLAGIVQQATNLLCIQVFSRDSTEIVAYHGKGATPPPFSRTLVQRCLEIKEPVAFFWDDSVTVESLIGCQWALSAPIVVDEREAYVLYADGTDSPEQMTAPGRAPGDLDRSVLSLVADVMKQYLEGRRAARIKEDMQAASLAQRELLPTRLDNIPGFSFDYIFTPSEFVSGDTLNVFRLTDDHLGFYLMDVSGHGLPAVMLATSVHRMLTPDMRSAMVLKKPMDSFPHRRLASPAEVVEALNRDLPLDRTGKLFSFFYGIIDLESRELVYSRAGHPPPFLQRKRGDLLRLDAGGPLVGLRRRGDWTEGRTILEKGDRIVLFSDGVIDVTDARSRPLGEEGLAAHLMEQHRLDLTDLLASIVEKATHFAGHPGFKDDFTLLGIECTS